MVSFPGKIIVGKGFSEVAKTAYNTEIEGITQQVKSLHSFGFSYEEWRLCINSKKGQIIALKTKTFVFDGLAGVWDNVQIQNHLKIRLFIQSKAMN